MHSLKNWKPLAQEYEYIPYQQANPVRKMFHE